MKRFVSILLIFAILISNVDIVYAKEVSFTVFDPDHDTLFTVYDDGSWENDLGMSGDDYYSDNNILFEADASSFIASLCSSVGVIFPSVAGVAAGLGLAGSALIHVISAVAEKDDSGNVKIKDSITSDPAKVETLKNMITSSMKDIYNEATGKRIWNGGTERNTDMMKMLQLVFPDADVIESNTCGANSNKYYVYFLPDDDSYYFGNDLTKGISLKSSNNSIKRYDFSYNVNNSTNKMYQAGRCVTSDPSKCYNLIKAYFEEGSASLTLLSSVDFYMSSRVYTGTYGSWRFITQHDIIGYKDFETMLDMKNNFNSPVYFTSNSITNLDEHVENFITNNNYNSNYDYSQLMQNTYNTINNNITQGSDLTAKDVQDIIDNSFNSSMEEMKDQLEYLNKTEEERNFELVKNFKELWKRFNNLDELLTLNNGFLSSIDNSMSELLQMDFGGGSTTNIENNIEVNTNIYNDISNYFDNGFTNGTGWSEVQETFKDKFPFCIPWDIMYLFYSFAAEPETPSWLWSWNVPLPFEQVYEVNIDINLAPFEPLAKVVRTFTSLFFIIFLINKTKDIIKEEVL